MLANIQVIVTIFGIIYFFSTLGVYGAPNYETFMSNGGEINRIGLTADQLNFICYKLGMTYDPSMRYKEEMKITGSCINHFIKVWNGHPNINKYVEPKAEVLLCDIGEDTKRCVTTTGVSGTYDYWAEQPLNRGMGCTYLGSITVDVNSSQSQPTPSGSAEA